MKRNKKIFIVLILILWVHPAFAQQRLSPKQIERVKALKMLLADADERPLEKIMEDLTQTPSPENNLLVLEGIAAAYADILKEYNVEGLERKKWLYSMVLLNMAYFQLGGADIERADEPGLNIVIRRKLKEYLPADLMTDPELFYSLE